MTAGPVVLRLLTGGSFALAALACAGATTATILGNDAMGFIAMCNLCALVGFILTAFIARSPIATIMVLLAVPLLMFDVVLRGISSVMATDVPRPISALTYYAGSGAFFPLLLSLLILGLSFSLRKRGPIAWIAAIAVVGATFVLGLLGRDGSMLTGIWFLAVAFDLIRPSRAHDVTGHVSTTP